MIKLTHKTQTQVSESATLTLPWEKRIKSRQRLVLDNKDEAGLFLERGQILRNGDMVSSDDGFHVKIIAAREQVSTARAKTSRQLNLACYHLGNRHVDLEIQNDFIRYPHDHVLDDMVRGLGLTITVEQAPFEPETGAYGNGHHHHH
ncbi:urease accessory protein UreE [uncultured Desulfobacter sp.]|uniref:urease accessory protein UreE n=1 Tax=uncultured Desulfobacter sp. TaxID=240139 RepID=UPI0029C71BE7|nr:urease accessory protein UreE [uncultured Desulfobacter sp.]